MRDRSATLVHTMLVAFAFVTVTRMGLPRASAFTRPTELPRPSSEGPEAAAATCAAEPFPTGAVVFVCDCADGADRSCRPGDDAASGADEEHPIRTLAAAERRFNALPAGGTVAFCRGGTFRSVERLTLVNYACRAEAPCTLREYRPRGASPDAPLPKLVFASAGLSFVDGGEADHDEGYRVRNLVLVGNHQETGVMVANDIDDVDVCDVTIRGFDVGMYVVAAWNHPEATGERGPTAYRYNRRIRLHGSFIEDNPNQGWLGACEECVVEANVFRGNGSAGTMLNHSIYFDQRGSRERVVGNVILENVHDARGRCQGVGIVVHGTHLDMTIEGNHLQEPVGTAGAGCWGIALDPGDEEAERFERIVVRGNHLDDLGNVGIGVAACIDCTIEDNVVRQGNWEFESTGIEAPDKRRGPGDPAIARVVIRGNRIVFRADADGTGVRLGAEGRGHVIRRNTIEHEGLGLLTCFDTPRPGRGYQSDENVCSAPNSTGFAWSVREPSLARVQALGRGDRHSQVGPRASTP